ncbi:hypothetical protein CIPAW_05G198200 [Carya illinoinensis]|uniref:Reverse transcriptase domain-containing protein n=1 Tax=Carya illinoinensis TaxID=32201 RepID=A0A8T1QLB1_CARIL|nr:hypothetical protein CIPAW_05G198200 [Carya illinoinensis]
MGPRINHLLFVDDCVIFYRDRQSDWINLRDVLEVYERAPAQILNRNKTSILFSTNTGAGVKDQIINAARAVVCGSYEKYLGLPSMFGKFKYSTFRGIKEHI